MSSSWDTLAHNSWAEMLVSSLNCWVLLLSCWSVDRCWSSNWWLILSRESSLTCKEFTCPIRVDTVLSWLSNLPSRSFKKALPSIPPRIQFPLSWFFYRIGGNLPPISAGKDCRAGSVLKSIPSESLVPGSSNPDLIEPCLDSSLL